MNAKEYAQSLIDLAVDGKVSNEVAFLMVLYSYYSDYASSEHDRGFYLEMLKYLFGSRTFGQQIRTPLPDGSTLVVNVDVTIEGDAGEGGIPVANL